MSETTTVPEARPRRMGRPPLPPEVRRETLRVGLTRAELDQLQREAVRQGVSVNALVRDRLGFGEPDF